MPRPAASRRDSALVGGQGNPHQPALRGSVSLLETPVLESGESLVGRLTALEAEIGRLKQERPPESVPSHPPATPAPITLAGSWREDGPAACCPHQGTAHCNCPPGASGRQAFGPTVKVTGLIQTDAVWFSQDARNRLSVEDVQDGADFRRTRLGASGRVASNVSYGLEFDFSLPGRPSFVDVQMTVERLPVVGDTRFGYWRQPFGMDALTSVRELTFLERALPFAFVPFRQTGVGLLDLTESDLTTWAIAIFRFPACRFRGA